MFELESWSESESHPVGRNGSDGQFFSLPSTITCGGQNDDIPSNPVHRWLDCQLCVSCISRLIQLSPAVPSWGPVQIQASKCSCNQGSVKYKISV